MDERRSTNDTLRLFIAVNLPPELLETIGAVQARLQRELASAPLRWARPESIHLTLKFLGDTEPQRVDKIVAALRGVAESHAAFEASVGGVGGFPNLRQPNVLWLGVNDAEDRLARLAASVDTAMATLGWPRETRPFAAHLTLARVAQNAGRDQRRRLGEQTAALPPANLGVLPVHSLHLMRSELKPAGSIYTALAEIWLEG